MRPSLTDHWLRSLAGQPVYVCVGAVAALLVVLWVCGAILARLFRNPYPYTAAPSLLTPAERVFYVALRQAVGAEHVIFAKVRLADILHLEQGVAGKRRWNAFTRISSKHADFVVCDPRDFRVLGVVELDDRSHQQRDRRERDDFFNAAFAAADIPVWRVRAQRGYPLEPLREQARVFLGKTA